MVSLVKPLRVLHIGPAPDYGRGGGVSVAAWPLLAAQVAEGADVTLLVLGELEHAAYDEAARIGVTLAVASSQRFETLSREGAAAVKRIRPNVVHLHSVFIPAHAQVARMLRHLDIPYVLSSHGGLNLWRGRLKKAVYGALVEKPYFRGAETIFVLTMREQQLSERWLGSRGRSPQYLELPNTIPALSSGTRLWTPPVRPKLITLSRFDVVKKGLDRLVEIARLMPSVQVSAYGSASRTERPQFERLCRRGLPDNMSFLGPVYGDDKMAAFTSATIYVQLSRDEGFGMAMVEAMRLAVPVALTRGCDIADTVAKENLGMVLPDNPVHAAAALASALEDSSRLAHWSHAGKEWTIDTLSPKRAAQRTIRAYEAITTRRW